MKKRILTTLLTIQTALGLSPVFAKDTKIVKVTPKQIESILTELYKNGLLVPSEDGESLKIDPYFLEDLNENNEDILVKPSIVDRLKERGILKDFESRKSTVCM